MKKHLSHLLVNAGLCDDQGMMGLIYFIFLAFNKDSGPRGGGGGTSSSSTTTSVDESVEEARRIMEKYK